MKQAFLPGYPAPLSAVTAAMKPALHFSHPPVPLSRIIAALLLLLFTAGLQASADPLKRAVNADSVRECRELLAQAGSARDAASRTIRGILYHNMSHLGDSYFIEEAQAELEGLSSPLALGYLGSLKTIAARRLKDGGKLLKARRMILDGLDLIDQTVNRFPNDTDLRLLRVENGLAVSQKSPIKRYKVIKKDLEYLIDHPALQKPDERSKVLYFAGMVHRDTRKNAEAEQYFSRAFQAAPQGRWGRKAQALLKP